MALDDILFIGASEPNMVMSIGTTMTGVIKDQLTDNSNRDMLVSTLTSQPGATCFAY